MQFRLTYRGHLPAKNRGSVEEKDHIRRQIAPQIRTLLDLNDVLHVVRNMEKAYEADRVRPIYSVEGQIVTPTPVRLVGERRFLPIVSSQLHLRAELDILFLRPSPPGALVTRGGDLDNRVKVLLDALCIPPPSQLPGVVPTDHASILPVLLEDDALVTALRVETDRLLTPNAAEQDVELLIQVTIKATKRTMQNSDFW